MKKIKLICMASIVLLTLSGCGGSQATPQVASKANSDSTNESKIKDGYALLYAYMENGDRLVRISTDYIEPKNDKIEVIKITESGFFPNYRVTDDMFKYGIVCLNDDKPQKDHLDNSDITKHCGSVYFTTSIDDTTKAVLANTLLTAYTFGLNIATNTYMIRKSFDKDKFLDIIEKNKLNEIRNKMLELVKFNDEINNKSQKECNSLYSERKTKYEENAKNIYIEYTFNDKSDLYKGNKVNGLHYLDLKAPLVKNYKYNYRNYFKNENILLENYSSIFENTKKNMLKQYENDILEYKNSLDRSFEYYKIAGQSSWRLNHNKNISFFVTAKVPDKIYYSPEKKNVVNIPITIEYAELKGMIPKSFVLSDENYELSVVPNADSSVTAISKNKTKSYITTKSITSYYSGLVYNSLDLNRELAPEVVSLPNSSIYTAISQEQKNKSDFLNIDKAKAKKHIIDYGYAVKYRINNTNIDKSIYQTKQISLYDIYQQYL